MEKIKKNFVPALLHVLYNLFVYYLFVLPLHLWMNGVNRLADQKESGTLSLTKSNSPWPFLSFMKAFLLEFLFDAMIMLSYVIGPLAAIFMLVSGAGFGGFIMVLVSAYYFPVMFTILRDLFALMILPFRKFISWVKKPAQYMDLKIENK